MALSSTVYAVTVHVSHVDRGVYETLELRVARHPSETAEYLVTRLLAYCLEYEEGIAFGDGLSTADTPAVLVRDLTGRITRWIEVGMPSAERLHRGSKLAGRAAVYTHRDLRQVLSQLEGRGVHRAADIPVYALDRAVVDALAGALDRRVELTINVMDGHAYIDGPGGSHTLSLEPAWFS
jgi:uncharacterized protein YaeQ